MVCKVELSEANRLLAVDAAKKLVGGDYYGAKIDSGEINPFDFVQPSRLPLNYSLSDEQYFSPDFLKGSVNTTFNFNNHQICDIGYSDYSAPRLFSARCPLVPSVDVFNSVLGVDGVILQTMCPNVVLPIYASSGFDNNASPPIVYPDNSTRLTSPVVANVQSVSVLTSGGHAITSTTVLTDWVVDSNMCPTQIDYSVVRYRDGLCQIIIFPQTKLVSSSLGVSSPVDVSFIYGYNFTSVIVDPTTESYRFSVTQDSPTTPTTPTTPTSGFPLMEFTTFFIVLMITLMLFGMATR